MQPTVGRAVHYQRQGQTLHAVITRVERKDGCPLAAGIETIRAWQAQESNYDVWLAVFLHTATIGTVEFSPMEIPYSGAAWVDKTWSWPPRVP